MPLHSRTQRSIRADQKRHLLYCYLCLFRGVRNPLFVHSAAAFVIAETRMSSDQPAAVSASPAPAQGEQVVAANQPDKQKHRGIPAAHFIVGFRRKNWALSCGDLLTEGA